MNFIKYCENWIKNKNITYTIDSNFENFYNLQKENMKNNNNPMFDYKLNNLTENNSFIIKLFHENKLIANGTAKYMTDNFYNYLKNDIFFKTINIDDIEYYKNIKGRCTFSGGIYIIDDYRKKHNLSTFLALFMRALCIEKFNSDVHFSIVREELKNKNINSFSYCHDKIKFITNDYSTLYFIWTERYISELIFQGIIRLA